MKDLLNHLPRLVKTYGKWPSYAVVLLGTAEGIAALGLIRSLVFALSLVSLVAISAAQAQITPPTIQTVTAADAQKSRDAALAYLAQELSKLSAMYQKADDAASQPGSPFYQEFVAQRMKELIVLQDAFKDNPWVRISGFTIGVPWGLGVNVEFK